MDIEWIKKTFLILILVGLSIFMGYLLGIRSGEREHYELVKRMDYKLSDRIPEGDILVFDDKIIILGKFEWSKYLDTKSMLPLLDEGSNGIEINVTNGTQLRVGDVVSFELEKEVIIHHRIINIGYDSKGLYYTTKGDNVQTEDAIKVRRSQIKRVLVGVIW